MAGYRISGRVLANGKFSNANIVIKDKKATRTNGSINRNCAADIHRCVSELILFYSRSSDFFRGGHSIDFSITVVQDESN